MTESHKKKSLFIEPRKKFDPAEKEVLCEVCGRLLVSEKYRWDKIEQGFFLTRRTEISHRRCKKSQKS